MEYLTERHKQCLKELLKLVRDGSIPEEFHIIYDMEGPLIVSSDQKFLRMEGLSRLGLEALTRAGYLFSLPTYERSSSEFGGRTTERESEDSRACYITPDGIRAADSNFSPFEDLTIRRAPVEITQSLGKFRADFPDPSRLAFIIMQFGKSVAHESILRAVRGALDPHGFVALRADDKQYHDDLFFNMLTYVYGCRFAIAIFERIEDEHFNPNVSLEVGYMFGLGKPVCYLKD